MDWEAIGVGAATVMSALALIVSTRGQRKADALAARSADATERMAVALERREIQDERHAPTPGAAWRLEHFQGDAYLLTNAGRATAYEVRVEVGDLITRDLPNGVHVGPDEALKFIAARTMATRDDTVTVSWTDRPDGGERSSWSRPLPPRPRR
ncbi:hypothetical protein ACI78T_13195 [Blastococcus sp. SYSU D00922]